MKKVCFMIALCFSVAHCMSQDVIITNEAKRIEAKVIEITDWQVMYQLIGDVDSTTYMLGISRVASIIFENGEVYVPTSSATSESPKVSMPPISEENGFKETLSSWEEEDEREIVINFSSGRSIILRPGTQLENVGGKIYYGGTQLKGNDVRDLLKQTCPDAYKEYKKGNRWCIFGLVPTGAGLFFLTKGLIYDLKNSAGEISAPPKDIWIGLGCTVLSLPFIIKGASHLNNVYKIYNQSCATLPQKKYATLSLNISPLNVGLSLSF